MNIFFLEDTNDTDLIAKSHYDKHVVKMILETAQVLSTVSRVNGVEQGYKATHKHHPMSIWAGESLENWRWLKTLGFSLCKEYTYRYGKIHKTQGVLESLEEPPIKDIGFTIPPQCMPEEYRCEAREYVKAYREYYMKDKAHIAKWTKRPVPDWFEFL
ncbi:MAG: hypothetical protein ACRC6T_12005 [Sarcina sp.]